MSYRSLLKFSKNIAPVVLMATSAPLVGTNNPTTTIPPVITPKIKRQSLHKFINSWPLSVENDEKNKVYDIVDKLSDSYSYPYQLLIIKKTVNEIIICHGSSLSLDFLNEIVSYIEEHQTNAKVIRNFYTSLYLWCIKNNNLYLFDKLCQTTSSDAIRNTTFNAVMTEIFDNKNYDEVDILKFLEIINKYDVKHDKSKEYPQTLYY